MSTRLWHHPFCRHCGNIVYHTFPWCQPLGRTSHYPGKLVCTYINVHTMSTYIDKRWHTLAMATLTTIAFYKITKCNLIPLVIGIPRTTNCLPWRRALVCITVSNPLMVACKRDTLEMTSLGKANGVISLMTEQSKREVKLYVTTTHHRVPKNRPGDAPLRRHPLYNWNWNRDEDYDMSSLCV